MKMIARSLLQSNAIGLREQQAIQMDPGLARWDRFEPSPQPILDFAGGEPMQKHGVRREYYDLYI
jgi:hypothetical protein